MTDKLQKDTRSKILALEVPHMSLEDRERAIKLLNSVENQNDDTQLMLRFLNREVIKLYKELQLVLDFHNNMKTKVHELDERTLSIKPYC